MPILTLILQIALPFTLLAWLALAPASGALAYGLQLGCITLTLLGLMVGALWTMPPFWTPWLYLALLAGIIVWQFVGGSVDISGWWASGKVQTAAIVIALLPGVAGAWLLTMALLGRIPPAVETFDIAPPFGEGTYLIASGGATANVNRHLKTMDPSVERFRPWRGQSRGLDIFRITPSGRHMEGWYPEDPSRYVTFGTPILAPCSGRVAHVTDGVPDNPVPIMNRDQMAGNFVAIECADNIFVILAHFREGSIGVKTGDRVATGDRLGEMGNSGNSSEPHLHVHAQRGLPQEAPLGGEPLAITINGRFLVQNDRVRVSTPY